MLTAALGLSLTCKPCQVSLNSLRLQGSPWSHLFLADDPLDLLLVLLLLFVVCFLFLFGPLAVSSLGSFLGPLGFVFG